MKDRNPYVLGEVTSQGIFVEKVHPNQGWTARNSCACCLRVVWCGGFNVCFECRTNDCESVHPDMQTEVPE